MNTQSNQSNNEIKMLHEVIADYKLQNEKLIEENKELKEEDEELKYEKKKLMEIYRNALMIDKLNEEFSVAQDTIIKGEKLLLLQREISKGLECAFQDLLIEHIKSTDHFQEGTELVLSGERMNYQHLVKNILDRMNADDWNEDGGRLSLEISIPNFRNTEKAFAIDLEYNQSDSDEED